MLNLARNNTTVNVERFVVLKIQFQPYKFFLWKYFTSALASSVYYLTIAKYLRKSFAVLLKQQKFSTANLYLFIVYYIKMPSYSI